MNISDRPYFRGAVETRDFAIGRAHMGRVSGRATLAFGYPVLDESGRLNAVLVTGLDLHWLGEFLKRMDLPPHSSLIFADRGGGILYGYPDPEKYIGQSMAEAPVVKAMMATGEGVVEAPGLGGGVLRLYGFASVDFRSQGLVLALGIPREAALEEANRDLRRNLTWLGLVALVSLAAAWFGGDLFIRRRVKELLAVTERLASGDLTVRTGPPYRSGELGLLARSFDLMADSIQERDARLKQAAGELNQRVRELDERTAQLEAANKELEAFSYSVSHDLRAPLRGIAGFSRILLEEYADKLDEEGKRYLNIIQSDTRKMGKLIDDLLAFSRFGRRQMNLTNFKLKPLVKDVFEELRELEPERNLQIQIKPLPPAHGDRDMIRQALVNLLANALKFTRTREAAIIEVSGWSEASENVYCVRDNGVGFEMEYVGKLFGVFQRLHPESQFEGTGVGLAIVQRIIERHGGRVWAEGKVEDGATFCFTLPQES